MKEDNEQFKGHGKFLTQIEFDHEEDYRGIRYGGCEMVSIIEHGILPRSPMRTSRKPQARLEYKGQMHQQFGSTPNNRHVWSRESLLGARFSCSVEVGVCSTKRT